MNLYNTTFAYEVIKYIFVKQFHNIKSNEGTVTYNMEILLQANKSGTICVSWTDDAEAIVYDLITHTLLAILKPAMLGLKELDMDHFVSPFGELIAFAGTKSVKGTYGVDIQVVWMSNQVRF